MLSTFFRKSRFVFKEGGALIEGDDTLLYAGSALL
jgi:hypothetical protein